MTNSFHIGVMQEEILEGLNIFPGETYIDCTFGGGTHSQAILELGGKVIGFEVDEEALKHAQKKFDLKVQNGVWVTKSSNLKIYRENFKNLNEVLVREGLDKVSGILFDLGVSSYQLDTPERGFSFSKSGPLDMRLDQRLSVSASDLIKVLNEGELYELFSRLGGERHARSIARDIVRYREQKEIKTTADLADLISKKRLGTDRIHPATRVFMALRIAVNDELGSLTEALPQATKFLRSAGRLCVISFHSLEDKIVKDFLKNTKDMKVITDNPAVASQKEQRQNPRARSAKLRIAEKI